jgi:hypothetical protein
MYESEASAARLGIDAIDLARRSKYYPRNSRQKFGE